MRGMTGIMKIVNLAENSSMYTSNAWLVTGDWRALEDRTTLIDAGTDPLVVQRIKDSDPGLGKRKLDQMILTHNHYDHTGNVTALKDLFQPTVLAWSASRIDVDRQVVDGERIRIGERNFEIIHMPGHSQDSILLFDEEEGVLFSGDSPLVIRSDGGQYETGFVQVLERLTRLPIRIMYPGHGKPLEGNCRKILEQSLRHVRAGYRYE